jgi:uncharacterized protein YbaR (Trm112 family)
MKEETIFCPKCKAQLDTSKENTVIYQAASPIELVNFTSLISPPLPTKYTEPAGRYCCHDCNFCFIIEEGW